ncbi:O-antigen ligase family protein [Arthrobacter alpinus]|nr:O-antigen ligase family protein [Arthrobacter alpinus]
MMPPRVGEIGAIIVGLTVLLWASKKLSFWTVPIAVALGSMLIVLSRTRTAPLALLVGLLVAFIATSGRASGRRGLTLLATVALLAAPFFPQIMTWALRNQDPAMIGKLSGRTTVWDFILSQEVSATTFWLGHGLGDKKVLLRRGEGDINVMAIDNSWLDAYWETGAIGVVFIVAVMIVAFIYVLRTPDAMTRMASTFLVVYVLVASINESGLCDLSSMTLLVLVAVTVSAIGRSRASPGP